MRRPVGRPRRYDEGGRTSMTVRLPIEDHERLTAAAEERYVSVNFMVERAIAALLNNLIPVDEIVQTRPAAADLPGGQPS